MYSKKILNQRNFLGSLELGKIEFNIKTRNHFIVYDIIFIIFLLFFFLT